MKTGRATRRRAPRPRYTLLKNLPEDYPTLILRGLVSSRLLIVTVSTPSASFALTDPSSTVGGRVKLRRKRLYRRSWSSS